LLPDRFSKDNKIQEYKRQLHNKNFSHNFTFERPLEAQGRR